MTTSTALTWFQRGLRIASLVAALVLVVLMVSRRPPGGANHMEAGVQLFQSGAYADAAHHFYRHAQANPDEAEPHLYLGMIHRRLGRTDLAGPALEEAERLAPDEAAVHREIGFLMIDTGSFAGAVERFETAISLDPDAGDAWLGLVSALRLDGRAGEADQRLTTAPPEVRASFENGDSVAGAP